jgi:hypothetical protein
VSDLTHYFRALELIVGDKTPDDKITFNFHWTDYVAAKRVIGDIRNMQKEIRLLKKNLTSEMSNVRSHHTTQKTAIGKGVGSALGGMLLGRKMVNSMNAVRRDDARVAQHQVMQPYEAMKHLMDQLLAKLDVVKLEIELSPEYRNRHSAQALPLPRPPNLSKSRYWAYLSNTVKGPFSCEQLSGLLAAHVADDTTLVCLDGLEEWKGFYEIPELAELLQ